ncbi:acyltransferase family protein [Mycolicibacterium komossense]|uniref:Acyltransferase family protein n=1 Tax=Mycolicibacterium komossense TaxID=1779 RepID=A0ABT3CJC3_9MYCO|nr:acyltransferase family protein [Mycolicibacterium komossense]
MPDVSAQPTLREPAADLYRVLAVVAVVLGHWLLAAVTFRDGRFGYDDVLVAMPWTQWLTWAFQVVPVFFVVGGYANAASWTHWRDSIGAAPQDWLRHRVTGILGPTTAYVATILTALAVAGWIGIDTTALAMPMWVLALHLWFIPVYLAAVSLTPVAVAAQQRWGLKVPAAMAVTVTLVDAISIGGHVAALGWVNYAVCWGAIYQLGVAWRRGQLRGHRPLLLAGSAGLVLATIIGAGLYPVAMIGVPGQPIQNTSPPTVALLAFAGVQAGLLLALAPAVSRVLRRGRWQRLVAVANINVLALYLWHMVPVVLVALAGYCGGLLPQPDLGSASWWWWRLAWVAILTAVTAAELGVLWAARSAFARPTPTLDVHLRPRWVMPLLVTGTALAAGALWRFAGHGFAPSGHVPFGSLLAYIAGIALLSIHPMSGAPATEMGTRSIPPLPIERPLL